MKLYSFFFLFLLNFGLPLISMEALQPGAPEKITSPFEYKTGYLQLLLKQCKAGKIKNTNHPLIPYFKKALALNSNDNSSEAREKEYGKINSRIDIFS
jgi:hypothetical protein